MGFKRLQGWCVNLSAMASGLLLSGCGGGGEGNVASIPRPPAPTYTKVADLSGDQTFQSAGIRYIFDYGNGSARGQISQTYGSGVVISYATASDSYTLTAPDGRIATFSSSTNTPPPVPARPSPNAVTLRNGADTFSVITPIVNGVTLSYTLFGSWTQINGSAGQTYIAATGVPTIASDMPKSGTASYQTSIEGSALTCNCSPYQLGPNSTATFSANFSTGTVATTLNLSGVTSSNPIAVALGSYLGSGAISSGGAGFSGTLASDSSSTISAAGQFSGAFFGPQAKEMGYAWYLATDGLNGFSAQGVVAGTK